MLVVCLIVSFLSYLLYRRWLAFRSYWRVRNVAGPSPYPLIGNMLDNVSGKMSFGEMCLNWSRQFRGEKLYGIRNFTKPFLILNCLDYVQTVLIKDFAHFTDRAPEPPSKINLSDQFLFIATGSKWRALRNKLSPVFTTGKLKRMVQQMNDCFGNTSRRIEQNGDEDISTDDFVQTYIIDATAEIVFGLDSSGLSESDSEFRRASQRMFRFDLKRFVSFVLYFMFPGVAALLGIPFVPTEQTAFFQGVLEQTFARRRADGRRRDDVVQLLMELRDRGRVDVDTWDQEDDYLRITEPSKTTETIEMTDELLTSQAMVFMTTGFDTLSSALTFTLVELCLNPDTMATAVREVDSVVSDHGHFTYQALKDMSYLEMCLMEAMRLHPAVPAYLRCCTKSYTFDNGVTVDKGAILIVPVLAVHMDPDLYPEPQQFQPLRFQHPPKPASYLAFGDGPRTCIAKRFALLEMKMMLSKLLHGYSVTLSPTTQLPVSTEKWNFMDKPDSPVYFRLVKRS